jgi:hypothetical protein
MTVRDLKEALRHIPANSEIVFFPEGSVEDENGNKLMAGIGYFEIEEKEFVYIGDIVIIENEEQYS